MNNEFIEVDNLKMETIMESIYAVDLMSDCVVYETFYLQTKETPTYNIIIDALGLCEDDIEDYRVRKIYITKWPL